jgi:hypothetical protein
MDGTGGVMGGDWMEGLEGATARYIGPRERWRGGVAFVGVEDVP